MADHLFDYHDTSAAFRYASTWYRSLVGAVDDLKMDNPWLKIAGEELVVTLKGMKLGQRKLPARVVSLIPHNPQLGS